MGNSVTDVVGIKVGHYTDKEAITGCTVILCERGAVAGVDVSGSAPGTKETDVLRPGNLVEKVQAVVLSGGSAFGLDAASGVMKYLEERGVGHETRAGLVPIVPAAIIFDLAIGSSEIRPGAEAGYQACLAATDAEVAEGCVGAGTGATVGKILGMERATKGGLGVASQELANGIVVAALMVVNAFGDVIDAKTGKVIAGPRRPNGGGFLSTAELLRKGKFGRNVLSSNTIIGVVATNAQLNKEQANKLAQMAQVGIARTIDPCRTMYDGDVIFALSCGKKKVDINALGSVAAQVVAMAIIRAVLQAETMAGIPSVKDLSRSQYGEA
ncbi:MAG: P1 family peptidase [Dehalococcoidia bacterium]|nr:P1 family peptidase [Dehalococcoidia bacterium]